jgi:hypothetical protein
MNDEEFQALREIDKRIAKKLGYYVAPLSDDDLRSGSGYRFALYTSRGVDLGAVKEEESAWVHADNRASDLNRAFALIKGFDVTLKTTGGNHEMSWSCSLSGWREDIKKAPYVQAHGVTPALAICNAWLAWKEVQA